LEDREESALLTRRGWRIQSLRLLTTETHRLFQLCQRSPEYRSRVRGRGRNALATSP
jgi:hypothetical protein